MEPVIFCMELSGRDSFHDNWSEEQNYQILYASLISLKFSIGTDTTLTRGDGQ